MESFNLFQEPFEPASVKIHVSQFLKGATDVDSGIVSELGSLYQIKYDGVFKAD
jgi:hypothetical protein